MGADARSAQKSIALVSGGLDSVVSLARAVKERRVESVMFFDYGQRARESERVSSMSAASFYGLPFEDIDVRWLETLSPRGMQSGAAGEAGTLTSLDEGWIPNRNGVFINIAAAYAERYRCDTIVTGFNREEAAEFPDNRAEYV